MLKGIEFLEVGKIMSILSVNHLNHNFGGREIFRDVSFRLLKGEHIGLIGANGEGKSTFMKVVTGRLEPDEGTVTWAKRVRPGYLDQHGSLTKDKTIRMVLQEAFSYLFDLEREMNQMFEQMAEADEKTLANLLEETGSIQGMLEYHDFYMIDAKIEEVGKGLGILEIGLDKKTEDLSGGQRTKVLLAKLLLEKPDILLLDEPTNFLDENHIEWLKRYLQTYENAFILISHDMDFLNSVINVVYHMDNGGLERFPGDYENFLKVKAVQKDQQVAAYKKQQKEIAELKDFVARNKARVSTRNMAMSRQKKLDKMDVISLGREKPKPNFAFKMDRAPGKYIFETENLVIGYDKALSKPLDLILERGQKIAMKGANGLGKTTLLKSLLGQIPPVSGKVQQGDYLSIGYFEQETMPSDRTCIEEIWAHFPGFSQYEVRAALARCGLTTEHIESKMFVLSGGEQAKVRLCKLMNDTFNVLLLDEPTNHLDVEAKEELKRALQEYDGTLLLICHEPEFYLDVVDEVWDFERFSVGGY